MTEDPMRTIATFPSDVDDMEELFGKVEVRGILWQAAQMTFQFLKLGMEAWASTCSP